MIFVTVGTHEQPFNRLVKYVDGMKAEGIFTEDIIIQTGFSTYEPKYCDWKKLFSFQEIYSLVNNARVIVTHGGPSSFMMPLQLGKIPIVVPRLKRFGEHVNDHQLEFAKAVVERQGNILLVEEFGQLKEMIINYESIVSSMSANLISNNARFNEKFSNLVNHLIYSNNRDKK